MRAVVFTGPSLDPDAAEAHLARHGAADVGVRPPAAHGDILRATLDGVGAIALIDGVFDRLPAVWHKEILHALSQGVAVYGAASMGALRASELDAFGMRGVGEVYRAFSSGELEDDDEVAVLHADGDDGYRSLSDAMVDVRATLRAAVDAGVTHRSAAERIIAEVKGRFYADRHLLLHLTGPELQELRDWVRVHRIHQKRIDAIALLDLVAAGDLVAPSPDWTLQHTQYWDAAYRRIVGEQRTSADGSIIAASETDHVGQVLDECRLDPVRYRELEDRALVALLAALATHQIGATGSDELAEAAVREAYAAFGITDGHALDDWLRTRGLEHGDLGWLSQRWSRRRSARRVVERALPAEIVRELRTTGEYGDLADRAGRKRDLLAHGAGTAAPSADQLTAWYFDVIGEPVPANIDLWAKHHGWRDGHDLVRALDREWRYRSVSPPAGPAA